MQAVILAAGTGCRLRSVLKGAPKCLSGIGGRSLIELQISLLRNFGVEEICVVTGYRSYQVCRATAGLCDHHIINRRYAETESLYSLSLAREWLSDSFLLCNGDVLAAPEIYRRLIGTAGNSLVYDSRSGAAAEHMKVACSNKRLTAISKSLNKSQIDGESVGIMKFEASTIPILFNEVASVLESEGEMQWAPAAVNRLAQKIRINAVDIAGLPWVELDFPEDLAYARTKIWPVIRTSPLVTGVSEHWSAVGSVSYRAGR